MSSLSLILGADEVRRTTRLFEKVRERARTGTVVVADAERGSEALRLVLSETGELQENVVALGTSANHDPDLAGSWLTSRLYPRITVAINHANLFRAHGDFVTVESLMLFAAMYQVDVFATFQFKRKDVEFIVEVLA